MRNPAGLWSFTGTNQVCSGHIRTICVYMRELDWGSLLRVALEALGYLNSCGDIGLSKKFWHVLQ